MGVIIRWFLAEDDDTAAATVSDYGAVLARPGADVGLGAVVYCDTLDALLSGRTEDELRAARGDPLLASHEEAVVSRLSPTLVANLGEVPDDAIPVLARSWASALSDDEPFDEAEARWILEQVVPLFRQAKAEGLRGYEFGSP